MGSFVRIRVQAHGDDASTDLGSVWAAEVGDPDRAVDATEVGAVERIEDVRAVGEPGALSDGERFYDRHVFAPVPRVAERIVENRRAG